VRQRERGTLPLETAIRILSSEPARMYGFGDRGVVAPGYKADLNVIDTDAVRPHELEIVYDLPAGAKRIIQHADGYAATIVDGEVVQREGEDTGARPGRVVRSTPAAR
jgi:N-acyl-D-aspartate/D-glutamate deacylase